MAEQRFERDLRTMLAEDLESVHGPHARWADAPVARRIERRSGTTRRWPVFAAFAAAALAVVVMVAVVGSSPSIPPTTPAPATASASIEPWPAIVPTAPTVGEVPLGGVAVVTQSSTPVMLVRVGPTASTRDGVTVRVEFRVVAALQEPVGLQRLIVIRNGHQEAPGLGIGGADPLALPGGSPAGTESSMVVTIPAGATENVQLGYISSRGQLAFWYGIHAFAPALAPGGCPTLADYLAAAAAPTPLPGGPVFPLVTADTKPTVGVLTPGQVGVLAAPDGSPGALFRVSNPRFCDRLPDDRLEQAVPLNSLPGDYRLLLVDVEFTVLKSGSLGQVFIPGTSVVWARWRQETALPDPAPYNFPGSTRQTSLNPSAGFSYRAAMSWAVEGAGRGGRIAVEIGPQDVASFEYLIQDGSTDRVPGRPLETPAPGATPSTGSQALDTWATVAADGALMPVFVGSVDVVDGYPRVMPVTPGEKFIEVLAHFGIPNATYTIEMADWVLVGPDGRNLPRLKDPGTGGTQLLPAFATPWSESRQVRPTDGLMYPLYVVAEVPPAGRVTLEYRPHGGPAQATWIVRDH